MSQIKSLRDHVCSYINERIKSGELRPNEKLNEPKICKDLEISRTPAREALIMLATDHIIDFIPRKGFYVREVTAEDMLEYYALMGNLDAFAAKLAMPYMSKQEIVKMREIAANINVAIEFSNFERYLVLQQDFHDVYIDNCGNTPLIETIQSLRYRYIPITYNQQKVNTNQYQQILFQTNDEHNHIIQCFENKDADGIENYIRDVHWATDYIDLL
ncbi:GntR family transcriptional regulator [Fusibacter paucivorans]|uniref:GntR family transcriptional regulator n=1 Tax=Fusibacter paucivorans TaxID=76009 RepID=A0ABS5PQP2_9FIRM|nr:GntR family transcriptional regulator [Fusibacter paucivorans]MBS7526367.1 GntR family transcriptional regulator [Fusibacter paucivorans]